MLPDLNLLWVDEPFSALGIEFSVDLDRLENLNFMRKMQEVKVLLDIWTWRPLSLCGKITVIKTLALSKFIHIFSSLPPISDSNLTTLSKVFYNFIWNSKQDKVNRLRLCCDYEHGVLRMTHLPSFIQAIHVSWIHRLMLNQDSQWAKLFTIWGGISPSYLSHFSAVQIIDFAKKRFSKHSFWYSVLLSWSKILKIYCNKLNDSVSPKCIWFNPEVKVNNDTVFYSTWYHNGVKYLSDFLDETGSILSFQDFCDKHSFTPNRLRYMDW